MNWFYKLRMAYKILLPVSVALIVVLTILTWQIQSKGSEIVQRVAERELVALGGAYGAEVQKFFNLTLNSAIENAGIIAYFEENGQDLSRKQMVSLTLKSRTSGQLIAAGIALLPTDEDAQYANTQGSDEKGQFYPYAVATGVELLNRSEFKSNYFTIPQRTKKPYIADPYYYTIDGKQVLMSTISAPIVVNNVFKGIAFLDFELERLNELTESIQVYETGGISVISQSGIYMAHYDKELVFKNAFDSERGRNNIEFKKAFEAGKSYITLDILDGVENFFYFHPFIFPQSGQTIYIGIVVPLHEVLADVEQLTNVTLIASAFALVVLLFVIFLGVRSSVKPLAILAAASDEVAKGNFDFKVDASKFGGEVLALNNALVSMLGTLGENIAKAEALSKDAQEATLKAEAATHEANLARVAAEGAKREGMLAAAIQLESVVSIVSTASQQLSVQVEQSERTAVMQAERMTETATAMEEMNSTVLEVAKSAGEASDISTKARACAENGTKIVKRAVAGIASVQTVSLALKDDMNVLAEKGKAISAIMNVISDIADQTNLLALNAAIEAARAGDAGRGFAVVADEVRKLAEKTMTATNEVGKSISDIQESVDISIKQVDKAVELIGVATGQSNESGESLNEIMGLVDTTADQVSSIATASEEQSSTSEEINRAITEMNELSLQSAQGMREAASAVNDLTTQAVTLSNLIEDMKKG